MKEFHFATTGLGTTGVSSVQGVVMGALFATTGFECLGSVQGVPYGDYWTVVPVRARCAHPNPAGPLGNMPFPCRLDLGTEVSLRSGLLSRLLSPVQSRIYWRLRYWFSTTGSELLVQCYWTVVPVRGKLGALIQTLQMHSGTCPFLLDWTPVQNYWFSTSWRSAVCGVGSG